MRDSENTYQNKSASCNCSGGRQGYTTSTVCDICSFDVLCSVTQPFCRFTPVSCCVIRRDFKKSWAVWPCHGKFLEVYMISAVICVLLRGFWHLRKQWLELFESTELISYLPSYLFLQRRFSFTLQKLYTSFSSEILIFLSAIWSSLCFSSLMYNDMIQFNCWRASLLNVFFVRLSQGHGFDPPCGSHQLPVFLKYSVRLKLLS